MTELQTSLTDRPVAMERFSSAPAPIKQTYTKPAINVMFADRETLGGVEAPQESQNGYYNS